MEADKLYFINAGSSSYDETVYKAWVTGYVAEDNNSYTPTAKDNFFIGAVTAGAGAAAALATSESGPVVSVIAAAAVGGAANAAANEIVQENHKHDNCNHEYHSGTYHGGTFILD